MSTYINPQNNRLTFELIEDTNIWDISERYKRLFSSILYLLQTQDKDSIDQDKNYEMFRLLEDMLPNIDQIKRMFSEPSEILLKLEELENKNIELSEKLRVTQERFVKLVKSTIVKEAETAENLLIPTE